MNPDYDPLEKLSLLAAHAVDMRNIPSDYQKITASDIAARLANASRGASLLGRVKVAEEYALIPDLVRELRGEVVRQRIVWPTNKKTRLPILAQTALLEVIDAKVCRWCKGAGWFPETDNEGQDTGKPKTCEACKGGKYAYTERARARYCDIHPEEWRRTWSRVYLEVLTIPWAWEAEVREVLKS